jgi:hypothetical protein
MTPYPALLLLTLIAHTTSSMEPMRARFDAAMADIIALEARIVPSTSEVGGEPFPNALVNALSTGNYNPDHVATRASRMFTRDGLQSGFSLVRGLIGAHYMRKLDDIFSVVQDELCELYERREAIVDACTYTADVSRLLQMASHHDPRSEGVVKSQQRVEHIYKLIVTGRNMDSLESEIAAMFAIVGSNRGKRVLAATVRASCEKVVSACSAGSPELADIRQKLAEHGDLLVAITHEKERAITEYGLGNSS